MRGTCLKIVEKAPLEMEVTRGADVPVGVPACGVKNDAFPGHPVLSQGERCVRLPAALPLPLGEVDVPPRVGGGGAGRAFHFWTKLWNCVSPTMFRMASSSKARGSQWMVLVRTSVSAACSPMMPELHIVI